MTLASIFIFMRTIIYIDGFNFYYGAVRKTPYKWLDFKKLFNLLLNDSNRIIKIKYFTAIVSGKYDKSKPARQKIYLKALQSHIPEIEIYYGHFRSNEKRAPLANPTQNNKYVNIIKTEEKGSDVNLAVHLLNDAWLNLYDCAVVVSNDSDLAEAMQLVKRHHPEKILGLIHPGKSHPSYELRRHADFFKRVRKGTLKIAQLPETIPGTKFSKPKNW